jgi:alpha-glucosidase (family GH31 glycosyl hydrolase)
VIAEDLPGRPIEYHGAAFRVFRKSPADEHYFGLGDKPGPLDRRNEAFVDWNTDAFGWQGVDRPHLQIDTLLHHLPQGNCRGHVPGQHLALQLRLQQGVP